MMPERICMSSKRPRASIAPSLFAVVVLTALSCKAEPRPENLRELLMEKADEYITAFYTQADRSHLELQNPPKALYRAQAHHSNLWFKEGLEYANHQVFSATTYTGPGGSEEVAELGFDVPGKETMEAEGVIAITVHCTVNFSDGTEAGGTIKFRPAVVPWRLPGDRVIRWDEADWRVVPPLEAS